MAHLSKRSFIVHLIRTASCLSPILLGILLGSNALAQPLPTESTPAPSESPADSTPSPSEPAAESPTTGDAPSESAPSETPSAIDLRVPVRGGIGHTTSGAGTDGVSHLEGFFPLRQDTGENITFVEARLLIDNGAHLGSNLILGHRAYDKDDNRTYAGYLGFDTRSTDDSVFPQFSLGLESLGKIWDFRINGYVPFNRRKEVSNNLINLGETNSTSFEANRLILATTLQQQRVRDFEGALPGLDFELGARVAKWKRGNLRAFAGGYFYDGLGQTDALGWRLRLEAEPTENISLGVSLQDDALFGTNIIGNIRLRLPGLRPRQKEQELDKYQRVAARLRDPIKRTDSVTIDTLRTVTDESIVESAPLMNPEEEQDYIFQHVTLGATGGDGTFENPFGTVQEALDATIGDGNDVVYVDGAVATDIPAFAIPDRVRVLSRGPVQRLAGIPFSTFPRGTVRLPFSPANNFDDGILVDLPFSGDGNFPTITGGGPDLVTLGNRTTLAGFLVQDAAGNGIVGQNVRSVELRNNVITNSGERGIFLDDVGDTAILFDNIVTGSQGAAPDSGQGLFIRNTTSANAVTATINGFQFDNNRVGIEAASEGDPGEFPSQIVNIAPSTPDNTSFGTSDDVVLTNSVNDNQDEGIIARAIQGGTQEVSIEGATVSNNGGNGITAQSGELNGTFIAAQEVFIRDTTIENNQGDGILAANSELASQELAITDNTIRDNQGAGIRATADDIAFQEFVTDAASDSEGISGNEISGNGEEGIILTASDNATQIADINANQVENNNAGAAGPDLLVTANDPNASVCLVPNNNTFGGGIILNSTSIPVPGGGGLVLQPLFQVGDRDNVAANNNNATVQFNNLATAAPDITIFEDFPNTTCFE